MGASETEAILADLAKGVHDAQKAAGEYTGKLCDSLDAFRRSMDRNSRVASWLTGALIALAAVSAFAAVAQALR